MKSKTSDVIERIINMRIEKSMRRKTQRCYSQLGNGFLNWLKLTDQDDIPLEEFTRAKVYEFIDYLALEQKISNRTINNYKGFLYGCFQMLVEREYIKTNPVFGIRNLRYTRQKKDAFSKLEARFLMRLIKSQDPKLYLYVLLVYATLIRPIEVRRMKFEMIDLENNLVNLPGEITKNWQYSSLTLPSWVVAEMKELGVDQEKKHNYIFGKGFVSEPTKPCGEHTANLRHKKFVKRGKRVGILREHANLSLYSWKFTGADHFAEICSPYELQAQIRHEDLKTTMLYMSRNTKVIAAIKNQESII